MKQTHPWMTKAVEEMNERALECWKNEWGEPMGDRLNVELAISIIASHVPDTVIEPEVDPLTFWAEQEEKREAEKKAALIKIMEAAEKAKQWFEHYEILTPFEQQLHDELESSITAMKKWKWYE